MKIKLIRHATLHVIYNGLSLLVDPMLSQKGELDPVRNSPNHHRNPLVDVPLDEKSLKAVVDQLDAVLVTHTHFDHWDGRAQELLPKAAPVFCQPEDTLNISEAGFTKTTPIDKETVWRGLRIFRAGGQHGTGEIGRRMGPVSGFVLSAEGEPTLYMAGDTIWCEKVALAIDWHKPGVIVVNAGAAQFNQGDPITMTARDVGRICQKSPRSRVIAVHMDAINHCLLSRTELAAEWMAEISAGQLIIPSDGQSMIFEA